MKTILHKASDRGKANFGWLQANYSFSFANYYNPERLQFGALRVLNDDLVAPSMGFSTHPHENMEIITIPLSGKLKHRDNMMDDWQEVLPNEVQVMSAGTGVYHSEMNASTSEYLSLFQIWIIPDTQNVTPRYDQKSFSKEERQNKLQVLVSSIKSDTENSLKIHQNAKISRIDMDKDSIFSYDTISEKHGVYLMNITGEISIDSVSLSTRDALGISETNSFQIKSITKSQLLFIEVPLD